jgi:2-oxoglutarate ferredoxin oxidoreductase subunit gamma
LAEVIVIQFKSEYKGFVMTENDIKRCYKVMFAGVGGKGVLTVGRLLAEAGLAEYKYSSFFPNYGPAQRGGDSECTVILSDEELDSPVQFDIPVAVVMDISTFEQFEDRILPGGTMIVDSTAVPNRSEREDINIHYIPAGWLANELGAGQVTNLVLLGSYLRLSGALPVPLIEKAIEVSMKGGRREAMIEINQKALRAGAMAE